MSSQFVKVPHSIFLLELSPGEFKVFVYLMKFGDRCWPSHQQIADDTGICLTSVKKYLDSIKLKNMIDWKRGRTGRNNRYVINHAIFSDAIRAHAESFQETGDALNGEDPYANIPVAEPDLINLSEINNFVSNEAIQDETQEGQ